MRDKSFSNFSIKDKLTKKEDIVDTRTKDDTYNNDYISYKDQWRHPKWQKKRLEIMNRDNFQCQCCFDKEETLTVHHKKYIKGRKAWEYENTLLITLCEDCHDNLHLNENSDSDLIYGIIKTELTYTDYYLLSERIRNIINEQDIERGISTISKLLLSQVIKKDQI